MPTLPLSRLQLAAVIDRLLSLPVSAPLKAMLTGVELLLAKAQVRESVCVRGQGPGRVCEGEHLLLLCAAVRVE